MRVRYCGIMLGVAVAGGMLWPMQQARADAFIFGCQGDIEAPVVASAAGICGPIKESHFPTGLAFADVHGILKADAIGIGFPNVDFSGNPIISAETSSANAQISDTLHISGPPSWTTPIPFQLTMRVDGFFYGQGGALVGAGLEERVDAGISDENGAVFWNEEPVGPDGPVAPLLTGGADHSGHTGSGSGVFGDLRTDPAGLILPADTGPHGAIVSFTITDTIMVDPSSPFVFIQSNLEALSNPSGDALPGLVEADFADTGTISAALPPGFTFTSDAGAPLPLTQLQLVPEPGSCALLALGLAGLAVPRFRQRRIVRRG